MHVVVATGYYTYDFHAPVDGDRVAEDELAAVIVRELTDGIDETGVRAGIIGEVGCNWPLHPDERKSVVAAGLAQAATGAPVSIHPGRSPRSPFEILEILSSAGADLGRVVMGHIERTELAREDLLALARTGCYLEYDWFGETLSMYPTGPGERAQRHRTHRPDPAAVRRGPRRAGPRLARRLPEDPARDVRRHGLRAPAGERGGLDAREGHDGR